MSMDLFDVKYLQNERRISILYRVLYIFVF